MVCDLLDRIRAPVDTYLFNCVALTRDLLGSSPYLVHWHPREENARCDALARVVVGASEPSFTLGPAVSRGRSFHHRHISRLLMAMTKWLAS